MCLITKQRCAKVSKKPVKCYKLLVNRNGEIKTPFRDIAIPEKVLSGEENFKPIRTGKTKLAPAWYSDDFDGFTVDYGFIHAYTSKREAVNQAKEWACESRIYECEIPAGVPYFKGKLHDICAHELKFKRLAFTGTPVWEDNNLLWHVKITEQ
jgi:hypothetical protein